MVAGGFIEALMEAAAHSLGIAFLPTFLTRSVRASDWCPCEGWAVEAPGAGDLSERKASLEARTRVRRLFAL